MNSCLDKIEKFSNHNFWTNSLGLARSLFALATLSTLIFNSPKLLFYSGLQNENKPDISNFGLNIYTWFPKLEYGYWFSIAVLIVVMTGIYPRFTCIFHWLATYSFFTLTTIGDGGDQTASIMTFLLIPICIFDKRKWHWSSKTYHYNFYSKSIAAIFHLLICVQVFIIYFFAAIGKFPSEVWRNGTALYYWFTEPLFGPGEFYTPFLKIIFKSSVAVSFLTWSVLLFELLLSFALFSDNRRIRFTLLVLGVLFHFGILLFFGLVSFSLVMSGSLILFLISKNNLQCIRQL